MTRWYEGPLAASTRRRTGVDVESDRIVSAALIVQDGRGRPGPLDALAGQSRIPVPPGATEVHGLTDEHLQRHGRGRRRW